MHYLLHIYIRCTPQYKKYDYLNDEIYLFTDLFRTETMLLLELLTDTKSHWQREVTMMKKTLLITFYAMLTCCSWNRLCAEDPPRNQCTQWAKHANKCLLSEYIPIYIYIYIYVYMYDYIFWNTHTHKQKLDIKPN